MSHDTDANPNPTPLGERSERSERIQRLRQAMRHPKILAADGWYTQEDDRIAPTDREYIAACDPATISELLSELDELWRIAGAYRPQKELADALNKSKSSRADAMNRLNAEQAKRLTLQHHAADLAQRVADLTAERDRLAELLAEIDGHTPGPWAPVEIMAFAAGFTVKDAECMAVARVMKTHGVAPLPARANAALIAAAPELLAEVRRLTTELAQAREVLSRLEWDSWGYDPYAEGRSHCPCCGWTKDEGHAPDCELYAALAAKGE